MISTVMQKPRSIKKHVLIHKKRVFQLCEQQKLATVLKKLVGVSIADVIGRCVGSAGYNCPFWGQLLPGAYLVLLFMFLIIQVNLGQDWFIVATDTWKNQYEAPCQICESDEQNNQFRKTDIWLLSVSLHSARPPMTGFGPLQHCIHGVAHR